MRSKLKALVARLPDTIKSGIATAFWTFCGTLALLATNTLANLAAWASSNGTTQLPGLSTIGYAAVAAVVAFASGVVATVVRWLQTKNVLPGQPPMFPGVPTGEVPPDADAGDIGEIVQP